MEIMAMKKSVNQIKCGNITNRLHQAEERISGLKQGQGVVSL
jgi:hypothetical protein